MRTDGGGGCLNPTCLLERSLPFILQAWPPVCGARTQVNGATQPNPCGSCPGPWLAHVPCPLPGCTRGMDAGPEGQGDSSITHDGPTVGATFPWKSPMLLGDVTGHGPARGKALSTGLPSSPDRDAGDREWHREIPRGWTMAADPGFSPQNVTFSKSFSETAGKADCQASEPAQTFRGHSGCCVAAIAGGSRGAQCGNHPGSAARLLLCSPWYLHDGVTWLSLDSRNSEGTRQGTCHYH